MLKNVLSLLLSRFYSKQESELVGHQATPSDSYVDFTLSKTETSSLGSTEEILNAIAPCDGYLFVRGRSLTDSHRLLLSTRAGMYINAYGKTITTQGTVVVFKGENISVSAVSMTDLKVRLYKFVGSVSGGVSTLKKLLLQGGGQCLNSLSSSLRRSSWLARRSGLLNKAYHPLRRKLPSVSVVNPLEEIGLLSPRPTTVSFALWPTQTRSLSKTMLGRGRDNRGHKDTQEPMLCVPRVALSRINWELQRLLHLLFVSLLIPTAPLDSAVGGASC